MKPWRVSGGSICEPHVPRAHLVAVGRARPCTRSPGRPTPLRRTRCRDGAPGVLSSGTGSARIAAHVGRVVEDLRARDDRGAGREIREVGRAGVRHVVVADRADREVGRAVAVQVAERAQREAELIGGIERDAPVLLGGDALAARAADPRRLRRARPRRVARPTSGSPTARRSLASGDPAGSQASERPKRTGGRSCAGKPPTPLAIWR